MIVMIFITITHIVNIMNIMNNMIITALMAMAGAVLALVLEMVWGCKRLELSFWLYVVERVLLAFHT